MHDVAGSEATGSIDAAHTSDLMETEVKQPCTIRLETLIGHHLPAPTMRSFPVSVSQGKPKPIFSRPTPKQRHRCQILRGRPKQLGHIFGFAVPLLIPERRAEVAQATGCQCLMQRQHSLKAFGAIEWIMVKHGEGSLQILTSHCSLSILDMRHRLQAYVVPIVAVAS